MRYSILAACFPWLGWLACVGMLGCSGAARGPYFGDERFLTLGVDPEGEAKRVIAKLEASGHPLAAHTRGRDFVALGFDEQGSRGIVRIVTARGIALALDPLPSDALQPGMRYALLLPPDDFAPDVDGDGNEEVFVAVLPYDGGEACLAAYRVHGAGAVERVQANVGAVVPSHAPWSRLIPCDTGEAHSEPAEPTEPAESTQPAEATEPAEPTQPIEPPTAHGHETPAQDAGSSPTP